MKNKKNGKMSTNENDIIKSDSTNNHERSFRDSMLESVGPMDCNYGYSVKKLSEYFQKNYPVYVMRGIDLNPHGNEFSEKEIFPLITTILSAFNSTIEFIEFKYSDYFTNSEINYLFQYFNGVIPSVDNVISPKFDFMDSLLNYGPRDFGQDDLNVFCEKINNIPEVEFFILSFMIIEDWEYFGKDKLYIKLSKEIE